MITIQAIAREMVKSVRGSEDAPGFDACVAEAAADVGAVIAAAGRVGYSLAPMEPTEGMIESAAKAAYETIEPRERYDGTLSGDERIESGYGLWPEVVTWIGAEAYRKAAKHALLAAFPAAPRLTTDESA